MSILPLPELPPQPEGIPLSVLDAYAGQPGSPLGVGFWPRVAARIIDLIVHYVIAIGSGIFFGVLVAIAAGLQIGPHRWRTANRTASHYLCWPCWAQLFLRQFAKASTEVRPANSFWA